ncbi:hypothetical protein [Desulfosarcina cetonica]|uniref:hypothetical protein n=1 Tax=Desulfosarcina cetonica TaxID=90730 RepID=UPI001FEF6F2B|nr:hypothetical protein [Desulfosarcina cetonica]
MLETVPLSLSPPSLTDSVSDLDRLQRGLKKAGWDLSRLNVGLASCASWPISYGRTIGISPPRSSAGNAPTKFSK